MKISGHGSYLKVFDLIYVNKRIVPMHITTSFLRGQGGVLMKIFSKSTF